HPDIDTFCIPPAGLQDYALNLLHLMSAPNQCQYEIQRMETSITKAPLILSLSPAHSLGVPLCMTTDTVEIRP
ncbi:hypothetical protein PAXRUDRAFT_155954, partial [Paxillus rubicundulus Ve08.2h10]